MKLLQRENEKLAERIAELSKQLMPRQSSRVHLDFDSFTESEQYVLLKAQQVCLECMQTQSFELLRENQEIISKAERIVFSAICELFTSCVKALMPDELHRYMFDNELLWFFEDFENQIDDVDKWPKEKREGYLKEFKDWEKKQKEWRENPELFFKENPEFRNIPPDDADLEAKF
jgi:hypothetical protein